MVSTNTYEKKRFNQLFTLFWLYTGIGHYFVEIFRKIFGQSFGDTISTLIYVCLVVYFVIGCFRYIQSHFTRNGLAFILFMFLLFWMQYIIFPDNRSSLMDYLPQFFVLCIPMYILGLSFDIDYQLYDYLKLSSVIILVINVAYYFYFILMGRNWIGDSMTLVSITLPSFMFLIGHFLSKKKTFFGVAIIVIGFIFAMLLGSRGGIVCILVYVALWCFKNISLRRSIVITSIIIIFSLLLLLGMFDDLIISLTKLTSNLSGSNRIVEFLNSGSFFEDTNRESITDIVYNNGILEHPFFGNGLFGDRIVMERYYRYGSTYSHNFYLEILCQFGFIIGGIIALVVTINIFKLYRHARNQYAISILCIFITMGFIKLFMSGSYLTSDFFFLLIGVMTHNKRFPFSYQTNTCYCKEE